MSQLSMHSSQLLRGIQRRLVSRHPSTLIPEILQRSVLSHRLLFIRLWHALAIGLSLLAAFSLRFDFSVPDTEVPRLVFGLVIVILAKMIVFYFFDIEHGWWRFAGISDLLRLLVANVTGSLL